MLDSSDLIFNHTAGKYAIIGGAFLGVVSVFHVHLFD